MEVALRETEVPVSLVVGVMPVAGVEAVPVAVVVEEGKTISGGTTASVPAADGSVDSLVCLHRLMDRKQLVGELVAVVCVVPLHIHYPMILRLVVGSLYCCGHMQAE